MSWSEPYSGDNDGDYNNPPKWRPTEPGQFLEGEVVSDRTVNTQYDSAARVMEIESADGTAHTVWCSASRLRRAMEEANVGEGDRIRIEFEGEMDVGKGNPLKLYTVRKWAAESGPEPQAAVASPAGESPSGDDWPF